MPNHSLSSALPDELRPFFWDVDFDTLTWEEFHSFITRRLLQSGDWQSIQWLRSRLDDEALRQWIYQHDGRGLSPRQIRFWELILDLDRRKTNRWIRKLKLQTWERRTDQ